LMSLLTPAAIAHSGRTNAQGCHHNRKTGGYHCHGTPVSVPRTNPIPEWNSSPLNVSPLDKMLYGKPTPEYGQLKSKPDSTVTTQEPTGTAEPQASETDIWRKDPSTITIEDVINLKLPNILPVE
jgi:hypothetical protein